MDRIFLEKYNHYNQRALLVAEEIAPYGAYNFCVSSFSETGALVVCEIVVSGYHEGNDYLQVPIHLLTCSDEEITVALQEHKEKIRQRKERRHKAEKRLRRVQEMKDKRQAEAHRRQLYEQLKAEFEGVGPYAEVDERSA
jgi:hypothetical protein